MPGVTGLPGTALVARKGSVRAELAGGLADVEAGLPCTVATRFQLCSVSKQFTAAVVLLLAEAGRLDLHEPVTLSPGFLLAGHTAERAAGQPYPQFLTRAHRGSAWPDRDDHRRCSGTGDL
jgi:CubicO group peptidase (beta-lactamase class C family)